MSSVTETQAAAQRSSSWRDKVSAEYEISQARLQYLLAQDEPAEEYL